MRSFEHVTRIIAPVAWLLLLSLPAAADVVDRPNIIFVLVDDMGFGDLSGYGNDAVKTEHIDRLAAESC